MGRIAPNAECRWMRLAIVPFKLFIEAFYLRFTQINFLTAKSITPIPTNNGIKPIILGTDTGFVSILPLAEFHSSWLVLCLCLWSESGQVLQRCPRGLQRRSFSTQENRSLSWNVFLRYHEHNVMEAAYKPAIESFNR